MRGKIPYHLDNRSQVNNWTFRVETRRSKALWHMDSYGIISSQTRQITALAKAAHIAAKGFCTIDPRLDDDLLRQGREDGWGAGPHGGQVRSEDINSYIPVIYYSNILQHIAISSMLDKIPQLYAVLYMYICMYAKLPNDFKSRMLLQHPTTMNHVAS